MNRFEELTRQLEAQQKTWLVTGCADFMGSSLFNVFGLRQDPVGAYATVIPKWTAALLAGQIARINGDGGTSRDSCFIANMVQASLFAAATMLTKTRNTAYKIAASGRTILNTLFKLFKLNFTSTRVSFDARAVYGDFRVGVLRHSQANISKAVLLLGYHRSHGLCDGVREIAVWYIRSEQVKAA